MNYNFTNRISHVKASAIREIFKATADPFIISFAGGNPSQEAFPVKDIQRISKEILDKNPISVLQYGITEGDKDLIKEATSFFNRKENCLKENDQMIITSGSQQIMEFSAKTFLNEGDVIIAENPSFLGALNSFKSLGAKVVGIESKDSELDLELLEETILNTKNVKMFYVIPNFQNPTGTTMSLETRKKLLKIAKKYQLLILEDNPYGDLRFSGEEIQSIKSLDDEGYVIYAASLSKIISPGMRVAACIANKDIIGRFVVCKQASDVHTNSWAQKVMAQFLKEVDMEKHIHDISQIYKHKCQLMIQEMENEFHPSVSFTRPEGGMFIWATLPESVNMNEFVKMALERNVAVVPGNAFLDDDTKECHSFRLNFSTPSDEKIIEGIHILGQLTYELIGG